MSRDWQSYLANVRTASAKVLLFTAGIGGTNAHCGAARVRN